MKLLFLVLVMLLLASTPIFAQSVDTAWVRRYNGPADDSDVARAIAIDSSGNIYVAGDSYDSTTRYDYATIKYGPGGDRLWVTRYNSSFNHNDYTQAVAVDGSGNVYVTGYSRGSETATDYATAKYDQDGNELWVRRYNGPGNDGDLASAMAIGSTGNIYVTGYSYSTETSYDYATIEYYPNGDTAWVRRYNGPGNQDDFALAIAIDGSGNVYVTGWSYDSVTSWDYTTIKYDSYGKELWVRRYNGQGNHFDDARALALDTSGNVYVTGHSYGSGTDYDYATIKYDSNGDELWVRRYNGPGNSTDYARAIKVDGLGNVYVTGYGDGSETGSDYATIKYDSSGNELWAKRYNGPGNSFDEAYAIALDGSNNVYVTGQSWGGSVSGADYATVKYNGAGNELWVVRYDGPVHSDWALAIAVDDSGSVYVTGGSYGSVIEPDYVTIKYVQKETSVQGEIDESVPHLFKLSQNYPNPFNSETKIEYYLPNYTSVNLSVHNIKGQKVKVLVDEFQTAGRKSVTWDGKDQRGRMVATGIYFYRLETGHYVETKKTLLLK